MKVHEIMTVDPICCYSTETADIAAKRMKEHNIGAIPVVESEKSYKIVGVITDRDLCLAVIADGKEARATQLHELMHAPVVWCGPDDEVDKVAELMKAQQIRRIPVLDSEHKIQGIVSTADITLYSDLSPECVEETFRNISRESEQEYVDRDLWGAMYIAPDTGSGPDVAK